MEYKSTNKIGLIGVGMVGASFAYSLVQQGLANELVLVDMDTARAEGEVMDLNHGLPFVRPMKISTGGYPDLADANVIVICAGANQRPGESRLDLLKRTPPYSTISLRSLRLLIKMRSSSWPQIRWISSPISPARLWASNLAR